MAIVNIQICLLSQLTSPGIIRDSSKKILNFPIKKKFFSSYNQVSEREREREREQERSIGFIFCY